MGLEKIESLPLIALLVVQVIFGFNYAAAKVIVADWPPLLWGAVRIGIAAIVMFGISFITVPKSKRRTDIRFLYRVFTYALIGIALNQAFFLMGLKYTSSTNSAILNTLTPIMTLFFAIMLGREQFTKLRGFGFLIAIGGVLILRHVEDINISTQTLRGDIFTLLNCLSLSLFLTISREFFKRNSTIWATAWMFLFGSILLGIVAVPDIADFHSPPITGTLLWAMIFNIVGATMITYFLNSWSLTKVSSSTVAIFIYLQPVIAVLNAWFTYGEVPTLRTLLALLFIFSGVILGVVVKRA